MKYTKFKKNSLQEIGYRTTYDLEIDDKNHNFLLSSGIISSNSHSIAYSINAYISMHLKVYYPKEYYSELLNFSQPSELNLFIKQAKCANINFQNFQIFKTSNRFEVDYNTDSIKFGLEIVKGLSNADKDIINNVSCSNVHELVQYILNNKVSKRSYEPLCRLNYFKPIFDNSKLLERIIDDCRKLKKNETLMGKIDKIINENNQIEDHTKSEFFKFQQQYLQFYIDEHPFLKFQSVIQEHKPELLDVVKSPAQLMNVEDGKYLLYGIINKINILKSKKTGKEYYKLVIEDAEQQIFLTIFNAVLLTNINESEAIVANVDKNNYGFTTKSKIQKFNIY